jgi:hypothetical protein
MAHLSVFGYGQAEGGIFYFTVMSKLVVGITQPLMLWLIGVFPWINTAGT